MKRFWVVVPVTLALIASACTGGGDSGKSDCVNGDVVNLTMWQGYTPPPPVSQSQEFLSLKGIVDAFNASHPGIHVTMVYQNSDFALTKSTVALQGDEAPDISYQYGTNMPQLAQTPKLVDLTDRVKDPDFNWKDYFEGERAVATVDGRVLGIPALVDNLAVVYNKDLLEKAGVPEPTPDWTWDDFRAAAAAVNDPANQVFGMVFPADGSETMVWQYEAMLWEAGGDILNGDNTKAVFNSPEGVRALTTLQEMKQDGSMYMDFHPDSSKYSQLFNSGKVGLLITGPWDLSSFPDVNYGVQVMPSFDKGGSHATIAGPDNWVIFNNGPECVDASWEFLKYLSSPDQLLKDSLATSHLPTRASVEKMPAFKKFDEKFPGAGTFASNLENVTKARPQVTQYPEISSALGRALVAVLLGKAEPQQALDDAAKQADGFLAVPQ